jgi:hypothetical protein
MDPVECGERVVRGIQRNDLYIFTHPEFKAVRASAARRCWRPSGRAHQSAARRAIKFLLSNPIFKPADGRHWCVAADGARPDSLVAATQV